MPPRKSRDYAAELDALQAKQRELKARMIRSLGELVDATGAQTLGFETLAGALVAATATTDPQALEGWRRQGAAFFLNRSRPRRSAGQERTGTTPDDDSGTGFGESEAGTREEGTQGAAEARGEAAGAQRTGDLGL